MPGPDTTNGTAINAVYIIIYIGVVLRVHAVSFPWLIPFDSVLVPFVYGRRAPRPVRSILSRDSTMSRSFGFERSGNPGAPAAEQ